MSTEQPPPSPVAPDSAASTAEIKTPSSAGAPQPHENGLHKEEHGEAPQSPASAADVSHVKSPAPATPIASPSADAALSPSPSVSSPPSLASQPSINGHPAPAHSASPPSSPVADAEDGERPQHRKHANDDIWDKKYGIIVSLSNGPPALRSCQTASHCPSDGQRGGSTSSC